MSGRHGIRAIALLVVLTGCHSDDPQPRLAQANPSPEDGSPLASAISDGDRRYANTDLLGALQAWDVAVEIARREGDVRAEAHVLTSKAIAAMELGRTREARRLAYEALHLKLTHQLRELLPRSYNLQGILAWRVGRLREAAAYYDSTLTIARSMNDALYVAKAAHNLGLVHTDLGRFAEARKGFGMMLDLGRQLDSARLEGNALINLGMLASWTDHPRSALGLIARGRSRFRETGYQLGEVAALEQLAGAYIVLGDPQPALAALDTALQLSRRYGFRAEEAGALTEMARLFEYLGSFPRALRLLEEASAVNEELGMAGRTATNIRKRAEIYLALDELEQARELGERALQMHLFGGHRYSALSDRLLLAEVAASAGDNTAAGVHLEAADMLAAGLGAVSPKLKVAVARARIADRQNRPDEVLRLLQETVSLFWRASFDTEWEVHTLAARAHRSVGNLDAAKQAAHRAVAAAEHGRRRVRSGALRASYLRDRMAAYTELVKVTLAMGRADEAFAASDRARVRHLPAGGLSGVAAAGEQGGEAYLARIDGLVTAIEKYERRNDRRAVGELEADLQRAREEYEKYAMRYAARAPGPQQSLEIDVEMVRRALGPDEVIVEYFLTPDRLFTFVVGSRGVWSRDSTVAGEGLSNRVRLVRDLIADPGVPADRVYEILETLYDFLIAPARNAGQLAGIQHVIVVPHGDLTYLPFDALRDRSSGRYLVEDFSLTYLPFAGALPVVRRTNEAAPTVPSSRTEAAAFAPSPRDLPGSRDEIRAVERQLPGARSWVGRRATEGRLRQALGRNAVVHVAAHGVMNAYNPLFSRIELARSGEGPMEDGRLEVHEILELDIQSDLVFLSGCETAVGGAGATVFARGDDYATLAQAFLGAGATNVIATLWPVTDDGAAEFTDRFYRGLAGGPSQALAQTKRELLAEPRYAHPYYWASYRLAGAADMRTQAAKVASPSVSP